MKKKSKKSFLANVCKISLKFLHVSIPPRDAASRPPSRRACQKRKSARKEFGKKLLKTKYLDRYDEHVHVGYRNFEPGAVMFGNIISREGNNDSGERRAEDKLKGMPCVVT